MFSMRNKENNFSIHTLIWRPEDAKLLVVITLGMLLVMYHKFIMISIYVTGLDKTKFLSVKL